MKQSRRTSFNIPCHAHFLTFSCFRRCQLLAYDSACHLLVNTINRARDQHKSDLWSYVFMPDHVHLLLRPHHADYSIPQILKTIKGLFAKQLIEDWKTRHPYRLKRLEIRTSTNTGYRVWQRGGGFDRNLFSHDLILRAIAYIEDNPVRKGLVSDSTEWIWSSARTRLGHNDVPLHVDAVNWELKNAE